MNNYGYYTKHFNVDKETILSFDAICETRDNHYEASKICNTNNFQVIEDEFTYNASQVTNVQKYFNTLLYSFYNIYGQRVHNLLISFDFDNSTITINGRTLKVEKDCEYTYKILKTKIKAANGIKGFYEFVLEAMHSNSVFNSRVYNILCKIGEGVK